MVSKHSRGKRSTPGALRQSGNGAIERRGNVRIPIAAADVEYALPFLLGGFSGRVTLRLGDVLPNVGHFYGPVGALFECLSERGQKNAWR